MLRETLANIDAASSEATGADAFAWSRVRADAMARLEGFLADDIPVFAVRISATAQQLVGWAESRRSLIRRIDEAEHHLGLMLPWK